MANPNCPTCCDDGCVPLCGIDPLQCNNICGCCCAKNVVIAPNRVLPKGTILARRADGKYDAYDPAAPAEGTVDPGTGQVFPNAGLNDPRGILKYDWTTDENSDRVANCPSCPSGCTTKEVLMYTCGEFSIESLNATAAQINAAASRGIGRVVSGTASGPGVFKLY